MKFAPTLLALSAATFMAGASAQTTFAVSSWLPPTHTATVSQKTWCDRLEAESSGLHEMQHPAQGRGRRAGHV